MIPRISRKAVVFLSAALWFTLWTVDSASAAVTSTVSHNNEADLRQRTRLLQGSNEKNSLWNNNLEDTTKTRKSVHLKTRDTTDNEEKAKSREKGLKKRSQAKPPAEIGKVVGKQSERQATLLPLGTISPTGGCQLNEFGLYGQPDTRSNVYTVQYLYQTSVFAGTSMTQLDNSVIQDVDNAITTSILPSFFDCAVRRRRHLQGGIVQAISSEPVDTLVPSGLMCTKLVDNSDCYVVQGLTTVIATGFRDVEELEVIFKEAVQIALQGNAILSNVDTSLILDVSALSDDRQTLPPIDTLASTPTAPTFSVPGPAPVPTITMAPFFALSDAPILDITFAPVPALPTRPIVEATEAPIALPQIMSTVPTLSTGAPAMLPLPTPVVATVPTNPVASPVSDMVRDQTSSDGGGGLDWWAWLFVVVAGGLLALCCLMIFRGRESTVGSFGTGKQGRGSNPDKDDAARRDDTDDPPYEPPPSSSDNLYTSPGMGVLSNNPPVPDPTPPTKDELSPSALFVSTAPTFISDTPDFVDDEAEFVNDTTAFVNNTDEYDDDEEEEEEEPTVSYSDDLDEDAEEDDGVEDEYDDVEDDGEDDEVEDVEGDAFEEEGSSYEEEELFEQESQQSENWGNPPQQFNSRF